MQVPVTRFTAGVATSFALFGSALLGALPASAATISAADCAAQSGQIAVRAVAINPGETITLSQTGVDGHFEGQGTAQVYCHSGANNLGDVTDAQVSIRITPNDPTIATSTFTISGLNGVPTANVSSSTPGNPVLIGPFTGTATFQISAPATLLPPGTVTEDVAVDVETVTQAWGGSITSGPGAPSHGPFAGGDILAQTPELDSLPLFAIGALSLLGYAQLRRRARRD